MPNDDENNAGLSEEFLSELLSGTEETLTESQKEKITGILYANFSQFHLNRETESNLLRIFNALYSKVTFLRDILLFPHYPEVTAAIAANSNFLTDIVVRNPELLYQLLDTSVIDNPPGEKELTETAKANLGIFRSFNSKLNYLKLFKRRYMLVTGARDIIFRLPLSETAAELSALARVVLSELFDICYKSVCDKYGYDPAEKNYAVISLGKLGGNELNYSSDVDLMVVLEKNEPLDSGKEYFELMTEVIRLFIKSASEVTDRGFLYRIDFRLRPDGRNSPLCRTITDYFRYYESRGENWERQMLIKADFLNGSRILFNRFINYLTPYIYPSSFFTHPVKQIRDLRRETVMHLGNGENIKLSEGGIRDVEFSIQALQLLHGGKISGLRISATLPALDSLLKHNIISGKEYRILKNAYTFYRKIEHYLQLMNDKQTHDIPAEGELLKKLSRYFGESDENSFREKVNEIKRLTAEVAASILSSEDDEEPEQSEKLNFANKSEAEKNLKYLREGRGLLGQKNFDTRTMKAFRKIEPQLYSYLKDSEFPDEVLKNFSDIIRATDFPHIWFEHCTDKKMMNTLLCLCEFSDKAARMLAQSREVRDFYLSGRVFRSPDKHDTDNYTTERMVFLLTVQTLLGIIECDELSRYLSEFVRNMLRKAAETIYPPETLQNIFIAVLGSSASDEMNFASDADILIAAGDETGLETVEKLSRDFLKEINKRLEPVKSDFRLRAEGASGRLVRSIGAYKTYFEKRMRTWEMQALTRVRFAGGSRKLFNDFMNNVYNRIKTEPAGKIKEDISSMRRKLYPSSGSLRGRYFDIKKSPGGMIDIEFIIQYLILANPGTFSELAGRDIASALDYLSDAGHIDNRTAGNLKENYQYLKKLVILNQTVFDAATARIQGGEIPVRVKAAAVKSGDLNYTEKKFKSITAFNRDCFGSFTD